MPDYSVVLSALKELQDVCPQMSQMLSHPSRKRRRPETLSFTHSFQSPNDMSKGALMNFDGTPRWRGRTERLSNHQKLKFFELEKRARLAWFEIVCELRKIPALRLEAAHIRLQECSDEVRDNLTTFAFYICDIDVSQSTTRSDFTPRGLVPKLKKFLQHPEDLGVLSPEPWLIDGDVIGADTPEQALILWATWHNRDLSKILRKGHVPVVAKAVPEKLLLTKARQLKKSLGKT